MDALFGKIIASAGVVAVAGCVFGGIITTTVKTSDVNDTHVSRQQIKKQEVIEHTVTETKTENINFETKTVSDNSIEYGKTVVRNEGSYGEKTLTYDVTYKGDEEISRKLVKEEITKKPVTKVIAKGTKIIWHCIDVTSYNKNPYDDNMCTSSTGEIRYVSDSQARYLDPEYVPGQYGHPWYNSK